MDEQNVSNSEETQVVASGCARQVSGEQVQFGPGVAASVSAGGDLSMSRAGALFVKSGGNMEVEMGGAQVIVAGGGMKITNGGAQVMVIGGNAEMINGGAQTMVVGGNVTIRKGFVGMLLSRGVTLAEGSRVLLNTPQAIAFGAALGAVYALVRWSLDKSKRGS